MDDILTYHLLLRVSKAQSFEVLNLTILKLINPAELQFH